MASLKFQDVIGFYQTNNNAVYKDLKTAYLGGKLTPFVGAGLSVFCGYKLWPSVLKELSAFIPDEESKQEALDLIERFEYLEAAEHIQKHYRPMLRRLQGIVSYDKLEACPDERLYSSAAWTLPYLFHNRPLMTTNFDGVLEYVFSRQGHAFERMVEPHDPSMLTQIRQQDIHGLFKLHGDIGRETASLDRLVFTQSQYDAAYSEDGKLMEELKQWYQNQTLLFLGCSLSMDKTMEVLRDVASANPGIRHFAIVGCDPKKYGDLLNRFGDLGIDAIFYDDTDPKNHDAVRVILERLLEETNAARYKQLRRDCRSAIALVEEKRPLMFDSEYFPFSGREEELARLTEFCEAEDRLLWWSVTGPGGMGKSRLVFEFCKKMRTEGWKVNRFEASPSRGGEARRLEELPGWTPDVAKTIVVLDDVQAYMESVCTWMTRMDRTPRSEELRILLLEREGKSISDSSWLGSDFKTSHLDEWCHGEGFLYLNPMTDDQLMAVMTDYAAAAGKTLNAELLLKTLERVDPEFKRPLYAVAIADARCQGKDPTNWDRDKILDTLLDRELKFHQDRLQGIDGKKPGKAVCSELENLLAQSCIRGFLPLEHVDLENGTYPFLQKRMKNAELWPEDFFKQIGILRHASFFKQEFDKDGKPIDHPYLKCEIKVIALTCPDLLKEHLVLKLAFEKGNMQLLLPNGWENDVVQLLFIMKLLSDHPDRFCNNSSFWHSFFEKKPTTVLHAVIYGRILWGYTTLQAELSRTAVDRLALLYEDSNHHNDIATSYGMGMNNLIRQHASQDSYRMLDNLSQLFQAHASNPKIAFAYIQSLFDLTVQRGSSEITEALTKIKQVYSKHSRVDDIASIYAQALLENFDGKEECCIRNFRTLEQLHFAHPNAEEVTNCLSYALYKLISEQPQNEYSVFLKKLEDLYNNSHNNQFVVEQYAFGLCAASDRQDNTDRLSTIETIESLYLRHINSQKVAIAFALSLGFLAEIQDSTERQITAYKLEQLYTNHDTVLGVAHALTLAFANQENLKDPDKCARASRILKDIHDKFPQSPEIAIKYAACLSCLCIHQSLADRIETVGQLKQLYLHYSKEEEFIKFYAMGLWSLVFEHEYSQLLASAEGLEELFRTHPNDYVVVHHFSDVLAKLSYHSQSENDIRKYHAKTGRLLQIFPNETELQINHALTCFDLTLVQQEADIPATVSDIAAFLKAHPGAIPGFLKALDEYLAEHPDHADRYRPLLKLGGDSHA